MKKYNITIQATIKSPLTEDKLRQELVIALFNEEKWMIPDSSGDPSIIDGDLEVYDYNEIDVVEILSA